MERAGCLSRPEGSPAFPSLNKSTRQRPASVARASKAGSRAHASRAASLASTSDGMKNGLGKIAGGRYSLPVLAALPMSTASAVATAPAAEIGLAPLAPEQLPVPEEQETLVEEEPAAPSSNVFAEFWAKYNELLAENPVMVKSATSFFGFMIGDICAQTIMGGAYDPFRTARLTAFGVLMDGPVGHCWYSTLDKNVMPEDPKSTKAIIIKTALDQLLWAPFFSCVFFTFIRTLEGHPEAALSTIQSELVPTIVANYALWPLAHLINFRFVPSQQRILYINFVQILWTSYLSNLANNGHASLFHH